MKSLTVWMYAAFCLAFLTVDVGASPTELVATEEILEPAEVYLAGPGL